MTYFELGYNQRLVGYYDKWYHYNCEDQGSAYDKGCMEETKSDQCVGDCTIIEANLAR